MRSLLEPCSQRKHVLPAFSFITLTLLMQVPAHAERMYQWQHPATGTTQLSGHAPAWYRGVEAGPRVLVFENGSLTDDTAITVSELQRQRLRHLAFGERVNENEHERRSRGTSSRRLSQGASGQDSDSAESREHTAGKQESLNVVQSTAEESIERLKTILDVWDRLRKVEAQAVLETEPPSTAEELTP